MMFEQLTEKIFQTTDNFVEVERSNGWSAFLAKRGLMRIVRNQLGLRHVSIYESPSNNNASRGAEGVDTPLRASQTLRRARGVLRDLLLSRFCADEEHRDDSATYPIGRQNETSISGTGHYHLRRKGAPTKTLTFTLYKGKRRERIESPIGTLLLAALRGGRRPLLQRPIPNGASPSRSSAADIGEASSTSSASSAPSSSSVPPEPSDCLSPSSASTPIVQKFHERFELRRPRQLLLSPLGLGMYLFSWRRQFPFALPTFLKVFDSLSAKFETADSLHRQISDFFTPQSEKLDEMSNGSTPSPEGLGGDRSINSIENVSHDSFKAAVQDKASWSHPILLQLQEDSCFVCFLSRPLISSANRFLQRHKLPLTIKKFNIDRNDIPPGMPVIRQTPTFILYKGDGVFDIWNEFRAVDVLPRIFSSAGSSPEHMTAEIPDIDASLTERMTLCAKKSKLWLTSARMQMQLDSILAAANDEDLTSGSGASENHHAGNQPSSSEMGENYNGLPTFLMALTATMEEDSAKARRMTQEGGETIEGNIAGLRAEVISLLKDCKAYNEIIAETCNQNASKLKGLVKEEEELLSWKLP